MDSDPFVTDVLHVLSRYSETAKDALAGDVLEVPNGGALPKDEAQEEALRQKSAEDELLVRRALDRFRAMAAAEQKRWKTGSGELLQIYVAARRQASDASGFGSGT
ncbi:unnamed protein product [Effrenium voratum]|nr:unnamed protein product [Effrenium voratum]